MLFKKVQAYYIGEDGLGQFAERKEGLLIAQNVFMHADGDELKVERFNPTGNTILIGIGASELMSAQEIVSCFAEIKKDGHCCEQ
ncbi:hypothetical protein AB685_14945 [Bacillus sp. LL01]|uniref:hypothetical protein n=1 Tax=Bacillus sp. LL01 TaxID=1665556 RepID=UPI00064D49B8|nr:hypothetical protein [Bacillus sp. LL01]KMJ58100.1 hypothetical protein AB685_14945 [Bacillus sp. LL01]